MDDEYLSEEIQEVAEPEDIEEVESEENPEVAEQGSEEAEEEVSRKTEADAAFAQMRRELEEKSKLESSFKEQEKRLKEIMTNFGFDGNSLEEIADAAEAHLSGKEITEVRKAREAAAAKAEEENRYKQEAEYYRKKEQQRILAEDLKAIQKLDPNVKDLKELGTEFFKLKAAGVETEVAFNAVRKAQEAKRIAPPEKIGKVNTKTKADRDFYTAEEADRLSEKDLDDPKVLEKVIKSMTKW